MKHPLLPRLVLWFVVTTGRASPRKEPIEHGDINNSEGKLWMAAMTMEFPIKEKADLEKCKPRVRIKATLFQRPSDLEYWVAEVQVLPQ